ncbi:MAG: ketoacyl-ACP synthase III [Caldiserica bacterium]|nr:ketoacyl-ACP synthase III [Caldisericota bacterium]
MNTEIRIVGTGSYLPEKVLTNFDLEKIVDTSDKWIRERTGIKERRIAAEYQATSDLGTEAALRALKMAGISPAEIDLIVVSTITPDMFFPSTACFIQKNIGAKNAAAFDVMAACSGFLYGLATVEGLVRGGRYKKVLLVASETLSKITDWEDRGTCVLLADGAGACVVVPDKEKHLLSYNLGASGEFGHLLYMPAGGSRLPASVETVKNKKHCLKMKGNELFKIAVRVLAEAGMKAIQEAGIKPEDISLFIPHQANWRIMKACARRIGIPEDKVFITIHKYGNTSASTIPIALDEAVREGRIKEGDLILLDAFGGGLTWGACVIRW